MLLRSYLNTYTDNIHHKINDVGMIERNILIGVLTVALIAGLTITLMDVAKPNKNRNIVTISSGVNTIEDKPIPFAMLINIGVLTSKHATPIIAASLTL
jgi:hypothetical protein